MSETNLLPFGGFKNERHKSFKIYIHHPIFNPTLHVFNNVSSAQIPCLWSGKKVTKNGDESSASLSGYVPIGINVPTFPPYAIALTKTICRLKRRNFYISSAYDQVWVWWILSVLPNAYNGYNNIQKTDKVNNMGLKFGGEPVYKR